MTFLEYGRLLLGKKDAVHDPRTFRLVDYVDGGTIQPPPPARNWTDKLGGSVPMYANDRLGDCTCASAAHMIMLWTSQASTMVTPAEADVIAAYSAISGYDPAVPGSDGGAVMLEALNYWRKTGISGHRIGAFVKVNHDDVESVKAAISMFGCVYVGARLPRTAQTPAPWTSSGGLSGDAAPGSWGGHALTAAAYDRSGVKFTTWDIPRQVAEWGWWLDYVDECYACVSQDWIADSSLAPSGFAIDKLISSLGALA